MTSPLLLVEDTPSLSLVYQSVLEKVGHKVDCAFTFAEARAAYTKGKHRTILLDLVLPDGDGSDLMGEILKSDPDCKIIVITANGSVNRAVEAMRAGAFDFLVKPFDESRFLSAVQNAIKAGELGKGRSKRKLAVATSEFHGFIGSSPPMQRVYEMVSSIGQSTATVFITGESGTGKEVCAQATHDVSNKSDGPFVPLNCGAIPRDLLESEVFGHLKGSFTGAIADKKGAAEMANGGTLFLDEICEMDLALQTKLLRFLQTSMIQPVGATMPKLVDVRIVCATNRDPREEVRAGRFREDLFYRLHVVPIHLPKLIERGEDVNEIASRILLQFSAEEKKSFKRLSESTKEAFRRYSWPGNVRQLLNALRNVVVLHDGEEVLPEMLPAEITQDSAPTRIEVQPAQDGPSDNWGPEPATTVHPFRTEVASPPAQSTLVGKTLAEVERELIEATIAHCGGSIPKAAHILDVSASTIYRKREAWAAQTRAS